jgi:hypothetical protein
MRKLGEMWMSEADTPGAVMRYFIAKQDVIGRRVFGYRESGVRG